MTVLEACRDVQARYRATRIECHGVQLDGLGSDDDAQLHVVAGYDALEHATGRAFVLGIDRETTHVPDGWVLQEARDEGVVLLRASAPRYVLPAGALVTTPRGEALVLERPRLVLHLSPPAARIVASLPGTVAELARRTRESLSRVTTVLDELERRRLVERSARSLARHPRVSIVIPAYGRAEATRRTIGSALAQAWPRDRLEVIVVDDASPRPLAFPGLPVRVVRLDRNQGVSAARNVGLEEASGELVAFLDSDCVASPGWLATLAPALEDAEVDVAGGRAIAPPGGGLVARYEAVRSPLDMGPHRSAVGLGEPVPYVPACNLLVRRSAAREMGGFREGMHLGEDVDFVWRMQAHARVVYEPAAEVVHHHRVRPLELLVRRAEYASSEASLARLHPASRRTFVLPLTVLAGLAALVMAPIAVVVLALLVDEVRTKRRTLRELGLPTQGVLAAVLRAHGASLYHLSGALSRYHGVLLLAIACAVPALRLPIALLAFTFPVVDARRKRVPIGFHVAFYTLEMAAYQLGVAWGRLVHRAWLVPRLVVRR